MEKEELKGKLAPIAFPTCGGWDHVRGRGHRKQICPPWALKKAVDLAHEQIPTHVNWRLLEDLEVAVTWIG